MSDTPEIKKEKTLKKPDIEGLKPADKVRIACEYILRKENKNSSDKTLSSTELYKKCQEDFPIIGDIVKNSFVSYLSLARKNTESIILCQGSKQGYYVDVIFEGIKEKEKEAALQEKEEEAALQEKEEKGNKGHLLEKDLYPVLLKWLLTEGKNERAEDISAIRSQRKGRWVNPDLVGLKITNLFGSTEVEITTIEAKLSPEHWSQWIFEAVAHTIFADRSYFAFVYSEENIEKIKNLDEIKHYAETFNVGILIVAISVEDYEKVSSQKKFKLTEENHKIITCYPAPYTKSHIKFKKSFLELSLDIKEEKQLYKFGKSLDTAIITL